MFERIIAFIVAIITIIIYLLTGCGCTGNSSKSSDFVKSGGIGSSSSLVSGTDISPYQCRVLSFNIEYEATNYSPDDVVKIIKDIGADVAILNEAHEVEKLREYHLPSTIITSALARSGMNYVFTHDWAVIASKYSMQQPFKGSRNKYLDSATLIDGKYYVIPVHFTDYPYQPFQLAKIPYCYDKCQRNICKGGKCTDEKAKREMIAEARAARGKDVDLLISAINTLRQKYAATYSQSVRSVHSSQNAPQSYLQPPIIIAGDFNEPSHLDWTVEAVSAGQKPLSVEFPTSKRLADESMIDLYRKVRPDPIADPGYTWPSRPMTIEELGEISKGAIKEQIETPSDRIDFIYGYGVTPIRAETLQTPSDHKAVLVDIII